ncbi:MAG: hypothetical protein DRJ42_15600 [Deltaproteobacteria bacterium]|nr:MAG: hypothetical protein DRJ42_15600 [Deltaproteobacteria bacterium]
MVLRLVPLTPALPVLFVLLAVFVLAACGSKSQLTVPNPGPDDSSVMPRIVDSGVDAPVDPPPPPPPPFDICVELPPDEPPSDLTVAFESRILAADVLFLVDTTGSMLDEIDQIRAALRDRIVPALISTIGDVHLSVASLADFPVDMYGASGDLPFVLLSESSGDISAIEGALDRLPVSSGADVPESQTEALYLAATGEGFGRTVRPSNCAPGTVGYPCFRAEGSRIILLFTDAPFHNGPGNTNPYGRAVVPRPHTYDQTVAALRGIGAKVLGLFSGGTDTDALRDLDAIARDTGAVTPDGVPIVVDIGADGSLLDEGVAESVRTLVEEVPIDIDILAEDVEGDAIDALEFVRGLETVSAIPRDGALDRGDRFDEVRPGTRVTFRVLLQNDRFPRGPEPVEYFLRIVLRGDGVTRLQTTEVKVVIPSISGGGC